MVDIGNNTNVRSIHLSPSSMVSSNSKYSSSESPTVRMKDIPQNTTSSNYSLRKVNCNSSSEVQRRTSLPIKSLDYSNEIMRRKESTASTKSIRFLDLKENIINSKEETSLVSHSTSRLQIYHEYNNPSVRFSVSSNQEEISKQETYDDALELNSFKGHRYSEEVVREEENSSHETMSIELARPLNDTIQISLGQEELETLQTRFKLGKMLPNCLSSIHSHMFLQKGLNLGECDKNSSTENEWYDLVDPELEPVHRGVMARTKDKYILMDVTSTTDKAVTGILIVLTMCGILLLFWYQNFGPGIKIGSQTTLKI